MSFVIQNETPRRPLQEQHAESIKSLFVDSHGIYKHEIARVTTHTPSSPSIVQFKPNTFRFDAFLPSEDFGDKDVGITTLFIQTRDKPGMEDELSTTWEALWRSTLKCTPIPEGSTASIIFSKMMIYESVITPGIKAHQGFSAKKMNDTKGSLSLDIHTGKRVHPERYEETKYNAFTEETDMICEIDKTLGNLTH